MSKLQDTDAYSHAQSLDEKPEKSLDGILEVSLEDELKTLILTML